MLEITRRLATLADSDTLVILARAGELRAQGRDVISFAAGEPDFSPPEHVLAAACDALRRGLVKYTAVPGLPELREAVARRASADTGLSFTAAETIVGCGAKQALFNAVQALVADGDEVLIPGPYWNSYAEIAKAAGGTPVVVPLPSESGFALDPARLLAAVTPRTRAILLNSPNNPTGQVYGAAELREIGTFALRNRIAVISDEIYDRLAYGTAAVSLLRACPEAREVVVLVNGVSKTYAMTGFRIGWAVGPAKVTAAMVRLQSHSTSNPSTPAQYAALEALRGPQDFLPKMVAELDARRRLMLEKLRALDGVELLEPRGAFYCLPRVTRWLGRRWKGKEIGDSTTLARIILDETGVAVVPGAAFGAEGHLRLSYATSRSQIETGLARVGELVAKLG
jgi:aspartate aminotransferase